MQHKRKERSGKGNYCKSSGHGRNLWDIGIINTK